jgi:hypothetical protein
MKSKTNWTVAASLFLSFLLLPNFVQAVPGTHTQGTSNQKIPATTSAQFANAREPTFKEYRGVRIGMPATEVRQKLGKPRATDKSQDLFTFGESEQAQIFYDEQEKVFAISIDFIGKNSDAPGPRDVLNEDVPARPDGSIYRMKQYPEVGYWVSYNRTKSDSPQVTITMQKIPQ